MKKQLKKLEKILPMIFENSSVTATFKVSGKKAKLVALEVDDDLDEEEVVIPKVNKHKVGYIA